MYMLILCTGNTCRSPMAEGIVQQLIEQRQLEKEIRVQSMGLAAYDGQLPTEQAIEVMRELDVDISDHKARRVMLQDLQEADLCYVMTLSHKNILLEALPELEDRILVLDIPDPYGRSVTTYRTCRDEMKAFFEEEFHRMENADAQ